MLYYSDIGSLDLETLLPLMPSDAREKVESKRRIQDRRLTLGSRLLLAYALAAMGIEDVDIHPDGNGKPHLTDHPDVHFNLSHSGRFVTCAVSDAEVGVDVEQVSRSDLKVAERFFTDTEQTYIAGSEDPGAAFCELWTLKEAFMKMTSLGFRLPLDAFSIEMDDRIRVHIDPTAIDTHDNLPADPTCVGFGLWGIADDSYRLAFCSTGEVADCRPASFQNLSPIEISSEQLAECARLTSSPS